MDNAALIFIIAVVCFVLGWTATAVVLAFAAMLVVVLWSFGVLGSLLFTSPPPR